MLAPDKKEPPFVPSDVGEPICPLAVVLLSVSAGIVLDRLMQPAFVHWLAIFCLVSGIWLFPRRVPFLSTVSFLMACACAAGMHHNLRWNYFAADDLGFVATDRAQPVCVEGVVTDFPKLINLPNSNRFASMERSGETRFCMRCTAVRDHRTWRSASGKMAVIVFDQCAGLRTGDHIKVFGHLVRPAAARNPGEFNFRLYERSQRRLCRLRVSSPACMTLLGRAPWWDLRWYVQDLRSNCQRVLAHYLPAPQSGLASAILLGAREYLGKERREAFFVTGTVHLLAISGLHIGILASAFFFAIRRTNFFSERALLVIVGVLCIIYALLTEARPPVMRATVLVLVVCLSRFFHREGFALNSLSAAALIVLLLNPTQLFQVGFHLSFLAVVALIWLTPLLVPERAADPLSTLVFQSRPWWDKQLRIFARRVVYWCAASFAIWCLTLPLLAHQFHLVSTIGLLLNVFLWVPVAMALFSGFAILISGAVMPPVAHVCAWLCASSFRCLEAAVHFAESLPLSYFWVAGPTSAAVLVFYGLLALTALNQRLRRRSLVWYLACAVTVFGLDYLTDSHRHGQLGTLRCTFLAVGHGTSVVLELPNGRTFLYDAGSLGGPEYPVSAISDCLWQYRISRLDGVILSHADADHYNAVPGLADRFDIGAVYVSPVMFDNVTESLAELRNAIIEADIPIEYLAKYQTLESDDSFSIDVLHPPARGVRGSDNANSIVLSLSYLGQQILLTGDLEADGLEQLFDVEGVDCLLAMAPHHGSARSDPVRFVSWCRPEYIVICAGHQHLNLSEHACGPYGNQGAQRVSYGLGRGDLPDHGRRRLAHRQGRCGVRIPLDPQGRKCLPVVAAKRSVLPSGTTRQLVFVVLNLPQPS